MPELKNSFTLSVGKSSIPIAPFEIWEVMLENSTIKFYKPLLLQPQPLPDDPEESCPQGKNDFLLVEYPDLNISTFADNREDLLEFVHSDIRFTWKHIVQVDPAKLDRSALQIKHHYLALAEEIYE